ncbi:MAG: MBL fold metallo-hydrolase [Candidatus Aminicenantes bacterium]|nr:MAG: MBL fold metallo-hydrolase [Candidatus Aminicenantes bacterium]
MICIRKYIFFFLLAVFLLNLATAHTIIEGIERGDSNKISDIELKNGEAAVWYLFHAGWAVKTSSALMIFDYLVDTEKPEPRSLSDGFVDPNEIKDLNVFLFISHRHGDHFDRNVLEWKKVIPNITYVFGWQAQEAEGHHAFGEDRVSKSIGPLKVKNIFHNFDNIPESAFLIEVDGLTIYFSGDHGNSPGALNPVYKDNIDYMSQQSNEFDLVFLSIFGSPTYDGELYAIDKFKPRVMLPMHYLGRESDAERFATLARSKFPKTELWYPLNRGDRFLYKNGKIFPLK